MLEKGRKMVHDETNLLSSFGLFFSPRSWPPRVITKEHSGKWKLLDRTITFSLEHVSVCCVFLFFKKAIFKINRQEYSLGVSVFSSSATCLKNVNLLYAYPVNIWYFLFYISLCFCNVSSQMLISVARGYQAFGRGGPLSHAQIE